MRPKYTDDKNHQFVWPVKPITAVCLAKPAVNENTRNMQSNSKKRTQMHLNQMNDSSIKKVQSQYMPKKCKKMQSVMWPVKKPSSNVTSTTKGQAQQENINVNI